ncbi:hypothetical protein B0H14DRAFT_2343917 [Mycena olivaceomarginata]|nr:hypothetical protein B0H14DRAFT_2343917 [Mycena olivaceomarginata]
MPVPQLNDNDHLAPAFAGSPFTMTQFNLGNGMNIMKCDAYDDFGSLCAVTVLGNYDPAVSSWFLYWPEEEGDRFALCCPPGTTLLIPASTVRYAFSEIRQGETRYLSNSTSTQRSGAGLSTGVCRMRTSRLGFSADRAPRNLDRFQSRLVLLSRVGELFV